MLGRFLTPDALIPDVTNGQAWNRYAYGYNDPTTFVDPTGHNPWLVALLAVGTVAAFDWGMQQSNPGWWNAKPPPCQCQPLANLTAAGYAWTGAGYAAAGVTAGFFTQDVEVTRFQGNPRPSWRSPETPTLTARLLGAEFNVQRGLGGLSQKSGMLAFGFDGAVGANALLGALFQGFGDVGDCLSPRERLYRAALAGAFAVPVGVSSAALAAGSVAAGASTVGAALLATGATALIDYFAVSPIRNRALDEVTR